MYTLALNDYAPLQGPSSGHASSERDEANPCRALGEILRGAKRQTNGPAAVTSAKIISGIVDREILPKLRGLHRADIDAATPDARTLARLLISNPDGFQAEIARRAVRGASWQVLAGEMLTPVARYLGVMWEQDLCDFFEVTDAMGRLHALLREAIGPQAWHGTEQPGCSILLAGAPGETHTFGLCHVAGQLRDAGWAATIVDGPGSDPPAALTAALANGWYDVLGLSLACDVHSPALQRAMPAIRRASRNPALHVVVGGALVARGGAELGMWGADACLTDPARLPLPQTTV